MAAATYNITVEQGATYTLTARTGTLLVDANGVPILDANGNQQIQTGTDYTGCHARAQIAYKKDKVTAAGTTTYPALVTVTDTDLVGGITLDSTGHITIVFPDTSMDALVYPTGVWDLKIYWPNGTESRVLEGTVTVDLAVTKDV